MYQQYLRFCIFWRKYTQLHWGGSEFLFLRHLIRRAQDKDWYVLENQISFLWKLLQKCWSRCCLCLRLWFFALGRIGFVMGRIQFLPPHEKLLRKVSICNGKHQWWSLLKSSPKYKNYLGIIWTNVVWSKWRLRVGHPLD